MLQACSSIGKHEEAVKGMEELCRAKAEAGGPATLQAVQAAGTSLEARLRVQQSLLSSTADARTVLL